MNCGGNPCNFFPCTGQLRSIERETIYIEGNRATVAAESPRLISSGGWGQELKLLYPSPMGGQKAGTWWNLGGLCKS